MAVPETFGALGTDVKPATQRIGFLLPPGNLAVERELPPLLPAGISMHCNRLSRPNSILSAESLLAMKSSIPRAAGDLAHMNPDVIVYACTSGSFLESDEKTDSICQEIETLTGIPAITTSQAVIDALKTMGLRKVFLVTPYTEKLNSAETRFLEAEGLEVSGLAGFYCRNSEEIRSISTKQVAELVMRHQEEIRQCDGVFISCTQLLTLDCLDELEDTLACPVITSNQASLWAALRRIRGGPCRKGGRLLREGLDGDA